MGRFRTGDRLAAGERVDCLYPELHRIAASRMHRERQEHTWSPTVLVNELYLELIKIRALRPPGEDANEREAFLRLSGYLMRRLLIHHSRPLSKKANKVTLGELDHDPDLRESGTEVLMRIDAMLDRLADIDPKFRVVVEMKVFEGRTSEEVAAATGCSLRTVSTHWSFAKRWLEHEFEAEAQRKKPA